MKFEFSAGGIVYKKDEGGLKILLAKHSYHKGWVFPKGLIDRDKKADGKIEFGLDPITFWYKFQEEKRKKTVYYFIMRYMGGDIADHDFEMEDVAWFDPEKVLATLTHKGEKEVFQKALPEIKKLSNS